MLFRSTTSETVYKTSDFSTFLYDEPRLILYGIRDGNKKELVKFDNEMTGAFVVFTFRCACTEMRNDDGVFPLAAKTEHVKKMVDFVKKRNLANRMGV